MIAIPDADGTDIRPVDPNTSKTFDSWRALEAKQQPIYPDREALQQVTDRLSTLPPLVFAGEADYLRSQLAKAARGEVFVLQGGDCAETFADSTADRIRNKIKTILQMSAVLTYGASMPVVKMGRMAGQFAKPRSSNDETIDGVTLPAYRGDAVNGFEFTAESRIPDPARLLQMYNTSSATLNLIRAFTKGGFADLRHVQEWNQGFVSNPAYKRYEQLAGEIDKALRFMKACGADFDALNTVNFFACHEALLLDYEAAMTRIDSRTGDLYDCSGHFLWIGERTRQLDGAHLDFMRQIKNPIGIKLGPTTSVDEALRYVDALDPDRIPGRLTFISRMGAGKVREALPALAEGVKNAGAEVVWVCDPMHGNTITSSTGYKTRRFEDVIDEVRGFFEVHEAVGSIAGGLHVELTGDDVTEVLGGAQEIDDQNLAERYETLVDPRLNHQQSLELSFLVSEILARRARKS